MALIVSAGYIKPHRITARGNYFVMNDKKVKGMYTIIDKFRLMWDYTPVYFYVVQESNPIDPIMIDRINTFMKANKIVKLRLKDVRHGSLLRSLYLRAEKESISQDGALKMIDEIEQKAGGELDTKLKLATTNLAEYEESQRKEYDRPYFQMSDPKKSYRLLRFLKQEKQIDDSEYTNFLYKVENHLINFDTLVDELRETHVVRVVEPLDEETERFISELSMQYEQDKAGQTQDLIGTKRGLKEMLSRPIHSILSFYAMIPASVVSSLIPDIEIHPAYPITPVALIISHGRIIRKKIKRHGSYFVIKDKKIRGVYSKLNECQYMWGKVPCFVYGVDGVTLEDKEMLKQLGKYIHRKEFPKTVKNKKNEVKNTNSLLHYLYSEGKLDEGQYRELTSKVLSRYIDPDELMEEFIKLELVKPVTPLNLGVNDFIGEIGAVNAQEWASITQDCRNIVKGLDDMTSKPVKQFLSAGVILAIGLVITIAAVVIPSNLPEIAKGLGNTHGSAGGFNLNPFAGILGGHFILPFIAKHLSFLLGWFA